MYWIACGGFAGMKIDIEKSEAPRPCLPAGTGRGFPER